MEVVTIYHVRPNIDEPDLNVPGVVRDSEGALYYLTRINPEELEEKK